MLSVKIPATPNVCVAIPFISPISCIRQKPLSANFCKIDTSGVFFTTEKCSEVRSVYSLLYFWGFLFY